MVKVKRQRMVIVRECIWSLVDEDFYAAAALGQMIYWSLRTEDIDAYLREEANRMRQTGEQVNVPLTYGWVYKTAEELAQELLDICSRQTMARRLDALVTAGWLEKRNNPRHQWDRTLQYRPNLQAIDEGLQELGYSLEDALPEKDWAVIREYQSTAQSESSISHSEQSSAQSEQWTAQPEKSNAHNEQSNGQGEKSNAPSEQAIPETIAKTKTKSIAREQAEQAAAAGPLVICSIHNAPMDRREKDGDIWYSHRLPDGQWCKGRPEDQPGYKTNRDDGAERRKYLEWAQTSSTKTCSECFRVVPVSHFCTDCGRCWECCDCEDSQLSEAHEEGHQQVER